MEPLEQPPMGCADDESTQRRRPLLSSRAADLGSEVSSEESESEAPSEEIRLRFSVGMHHVMVCKTPKRAALTANLGLRRNLGSIWCPTGPQEQPTRHPNS